MGREEYSEASRQSWGSAAGTWASAGERPDKGASAATAAWMLEAADLHPGQRILELACGAGRVGLQAAEAVGEDGLVVCSDFAEPMVEAVRARADALGLANVSARVLDAEELEIPADERFDRVLCRFGFMLMARPARAMGEARRVLEPDGHLVLGVWGPATENPWLATILEALLAHFDAPRPAPGTPGPFALGDEARLRELLAEAGFGETAVSRLEVEQTYDSLETWWEEVVAAGGPLAAALATIPDDAVAAIRERAMERAGSFAGDGGGVAFPATVLAAVSAPSA